MKKRLLAALLALTLVCALLPATAMAEDSDFLIQENGIGRVELVKYNGPGGDVVIPDGVSAIGSSAFSGRTNVTSIIIPASVTDAISLYSWPSAISGCTSLTSITVAEDNTIFASRDGVLFNKAKTELIAYPKGKSGPYTVPSSVTCIGKWAFGYCQNLTSVTIPDSVTTMGTGAFHSCSGLTNVTIPEGVTSIGDHAFQNCSNLTDVTISDGVTCIGGGAFYNCASLTSVTIPESVTSIGMRAFNGCESLTSVTIPEGVTSIALEAFRDCTALTSVTIPNSVTHIWNSAFRGCTALTDITIPDSVTTIGDYAFAYCTALADITIPDSVTIIGSDAFWHCTSLTDVTIPYSVAEIRDGAFVGCTGLTSVTIPASTVDIQARAFAGCPDLTVYGYTGSEAERYCAEEDVPFVSIGFAPGVAREGSLESDNGESVSWAITEEGEITIDVAATDLAPEEKILVGCYDNKGRFTGVKVLDASNTSAQIDPTTPNVKIFWLGAGVKPQSSNVTVWGK